MPFICSPLPCAGNARTRAMHVQELARLGARIDHKGDTMLVTGVAGLRGAQVMATDLRASILLIIARLPRRARR